MNSDSSSPDLIDVLVDEFVSRQLAGESPSMSEYCEKHPELADDIRELFPMMSIMQSAMSDSMGVGSADTLSSEQIGDYLIVREIGRGGMGVVYEAQHKQLGRPVALKVLARRLASNKRALARFHREARAVAKLHHTNIVPLFEVGDDDGQSFLTMQLIRGTSLDQMIDQFQSNVMEPSGNRVDSKTSSSDTDSSKKMHASGHSESGIGQDSLHDSSHGIIDLLKSSSGGSESRSSHGGGKRFRAAVRVALQIAEALKYAHGRGIIHRDVKPSNILLDENGVVWLTDFGLAKSDEDEQSEDLTQTGDFLGTMRYMAPERFRGECDERADIYALGLTLYEMLTGKEVFESLDRLKLMRMIDESEPTSPRAIDPRIPRDLETIVLKSISKDPSSRYKSAGALAEDLRRFIQDRPIKARRHTMAERQVRWSRRNKSLAAAFSGIATLLVLMVVGLSIANIRESGLLKQSDTARQTAIERGDQLEQNLYFSDMNLAGQAASQTISIESLGPLLAKWVPEKVGRELRGWEWYYLSSLTKQMIYSSPRLFKGSFCWCWSVDYCPDGTEFVNTVNGWGIQIRNSAGEVLREKQMGSARFVHWSPDGTRIAVAGFGSPAKVLICDSQSLEIVIEFECADHGEIECARWSPDSSRIVVGGDAKFATEPFNLRIYDAATGELDQSFETSVAPRCADWSPDGSRIASGTGHTTDTRIRVWSTLTGKMLAELEGLEHDPYDIRWNPDGTKLAIAGSSPQVWHVDPKKENQLVVQAREFQSRSIAWHPLTDQLAVGCSDGSIQLLDGNTLKRTRTLKSHIDQIWSLAWRKGGTQLASSNLYSGRIDIWNVGPDDQNLVLHPQQSGFYRIPTQLAWLPDGNSLAGTYDLWNLSSGDRLKMDPDTTFEKLAVSLSDGRIAFGGQRPDVVVRTSDGLESQSMPGRVDTASAIGWSRDGQLTILSKKGHLSAWDAGGKRTIKSKQLHDDKGLHLQWSPDSRRVATTGIDNFIRVWDSSTWDLVWESRDELHPVSQVCWNADGSRMATSHDGILKIWNGETGEHLDTFDDIQEDFRSLDWSPDGSRLAVGSNSSLTVWDVQQKRVALRLTPGCGAVRWNPDGQRLAIGAAGVGTIRILDARPGYGADFIAH